MIPQDLRTIFNLIRAYDIDEFELTLDRFRVYVVRRPAVGTRNESGNASESAGAECQDGLRLARLYEDGALRLIRSPRIGVFSASISDRGNGKITAGCRVRKATVLGTITALGISSDVVASVDGVLAAIYVADGQRIEYGQLICAIAV